MKNLRTVRGVNDLFPEALDKHNYIKEVGSTICKNFCFQEIDIPIFEFADLFIKPLGETSDIVTKENYIFNDRSNNTLMLRPEGTAGIVRAIINAGLTQSLPQRYYYYGPMFRYERPQKGRLRQFHQFGVELLGIESFLGDVEVIKLAYSFLKKLNLLEKTVLYINSLGDSESRLKYRNEIVSYFGKYKNDLSVESKIRLEKNPLRILDSKDSNDKEIIAGAPEFINFLNSKSKDYFEKVCRSLEALQIPFCVDQKLVRGLDYYSHTTFEFKTSYVGTQDTILAGGRYDGLSKMISNFNIPGVGWAAGIERISLMIQRKYIFEPDVILIAQSDKINLKILKIHELLLENDLKTEMIYSGSLNKKLKRANKVSAKFAIIVGENELNNKVVMFKNLQNGKQELVELDALIKKLKNCINSTC